MWPLARICDNEAPAQRRALPFAEAGRSGTNVSPRLMPGPMAVRWWLVACAVLCTGCTQPTDSGESVARAFVDRLFVEANQSAALPLTEGLARAKVAEEIRLVGDRPSTQPSERSRVYYRELSREVQDDGLTFYFRLTVMVIGDQPIEPELIVRVRRRGNEWRVSNYEVMPPQTPSPRA